MAAGGGKLRLFVIGNYVAQRLLRPYHDWAMRTLRALSTDGTYNQLAPLKNVFGSAEIYSFDLKSATDRFPRLYMGGVLLHLFGVEVSMAIMESSLGQGFITLSKPLVRKATIVRFRQGTPLGFCSAWPIFSLCHHTLVWLAARKVLPGRKFTRYAILGDDLVIAHASVAREYRRMMDAMGVDININKSLSSHCGAFEFAKKFYMHRGSFDASPVSIKALMHCRTTLGVSTIGDMYNTPLRVLLRIAGAGYRVLATIASKSLLARRWERIKAFICKPYLTDDTALEWWFSRYQKPLH